MFEMQSRVPEVCSGASDTKVDTMDLVEIVGSFVDPLVIVAVIIEGVGAVGVNETPIIAIDPCHGRQPSHNKGMQWL